MMLYLAQRVVVLRRGARQEWTTPECLDLNGPHRDNTGMEFTREQENTIQNGNPLEINVGGTPCVVILRETYNKLVLAMDEYDPDEGLAPMNEVMAEDDANDPLLESYQKYAK